MSRIRPLAGIGSVLLDMYVGSESFRPALRYAKPKRRGETPISRARPLGELGVGLPRLRDGVQFSAGFPCLRCGLAGNDGSHQFWREASGRGETPLILPASRLNADAVAENWDTLVTCAVVLIEIGALKVASGHFRWNSFDFYEFSFDKAAEVVYVVNVRSVGTDLVEETANRSQLSRETLLGHFT